MSRRVAAAALLGLFLTLCMPVEASSTLPPIPEVKPVRFPPETRAQVKQAYKAALASPRDPKAVGELGMLLDLYHRSAAAVQCYQRAHLLEPRTFRWLYYLGSLHLNQKENARAVVALQQALALKPHYVAAELDLALALLDSGKEAASEGVYKSILATWPESAEAYFGLGRIYANRGKPKQAIEYYRRACALFPFYGAAHYALARLYRLQGSAAKAKEELQLYTQHPNVLPPVPDPLRDAQWALNRDANSHLDRGFVLAQAGHLKAAIQEHEEALRLDPNLVLAHANLIILYGRMGMTAKAKQQYEDVTALAPNRFPQARYNYGVILLKQGHYQEAEKAFKDALRINPQYPEAHFNLGMAFEEQGNLSQALAEFKEALQDKPGDPEAHFQMGKILVNEGQYSEAIQHFLKALSGDSEAPVYLYALGATYARAGDRQSALRYLKMALSQALVRHQQTLVGSIEQDLKALSNERPGDHPSGASPNR